MDLMCCCFGMPLNDGIDALSSSKIGDNVRGYVRIFSIIDIFINVIFLIVGSYVLGSNGKMAKSNLNTCSTTFYEFMISFVVITLIDFIFSIILIWCRGSGPSIYSRKYFDEKTENEQPIFKLLMTIIYVALTIWIAIINFENIDCIKKSHIFRYTLLYFIVHCIKMIMFVWFSIETISKIIKKRIEISNINRQMIENHRKYKESVNNPSGSTSNPI